MNIKEFLSNKKSDITIEEFFELIESENVKIVSTRVLSGVIGIGVEFDSEVYYRYFSKDDILKIILCTLVKLNVCVEECKLKLLDIIQKYDTKELL